MTTQIRYSKQREEIFNILTKSKEHVSAAQIYETLRPKISNLSLGTVYRNLKFLEESGKIIKIITPQNIERYDADLSNHAHFICDKCGSIIDLQPVENESLKQQFGINKYTIVNKVTVVFSGICDDCAKQHQ